MSDNSLFNLTHLKKKKQNLRCIAKVWELAKNEVPGRCPCKMLGKKKNN